MTPKSVIIILVLTFCYNNYYYVKAAEDKESENILKGSYKAEYSLKNRHYHKKREIPFRPVLWVQNHLEKPFKYLSKKIQDPIKQVIDFFNKDKNNEKESRPHPLSVFEKEFDKLFGTQAEMNKNEEHGRLDSVGRDVLRNLKSELDSFNTKVFKKAETEGLDTNKTFFSGLKEQFENRVRAIVPGTKWCGDGDIAKNKDDLGVFSDADRCCRAHDSCPMSIGGGESKYGLKNTGLFTRSSCECDRNFYNCLKTADNIISNEIGFTYFSVLGPQCIRRVQCERRNCNANQGVVEATYEWADNPKY